MPSETGHIGPIFDGTSGVFVTGTGTDVGKTVVAATIARRLAEEGKRVAVFKPAVTGLDEFGGREVGDPVAGPPPRMAGKGAARRPDHEALRAAAGSEQSDGEIAPYRYGPPMSPHLAAELAGEEISRERLLEAARAAAAGSDVLVCEGVGGLLVPLAGFFSVADGPKGTAPHAEGQEGTTPYLVRDFAVDLGLPLVVAASPGLGTINHTLLTLEAARAVGLEVAKVVLTPWPESPSTIEESNRATIAALGEVNVAVLASLDLDNQASWPALP